MIKYCRRCLYNTSHPLKLIIDESGICSGCRTHEEKDTIDWGKRWAELEELVGQYRVKSKKSYDCIIPVTGANDSYYIVHLVKKKLGLNPLLVTYNKYYNTPVGVRNLANLRIQFDCDILTQNVNPISVKNITRSTLRNFGSIYWHCIAGQTVFPVQTAVRYKIPLIIWGAHQGLEQTGMFSHDHRVEMTRRYRKEHDLMGWEADDLLSNFDSLNEDDVWQYRYPDDADINSVGVRGIYLGNYVRWDPKAQHEKMIELYKYRSASFPRTFETYDHVDCYNYMDLHDHLKQIKHGYSKVLDHASREIRHGRLSRNEGATLVQHHENSKLEHTDKFCKWLGIKARSLEFITDQHRNPRIWRRDQPSDKWVKICSSVDGNDLNTTPNNEISFSSDGSVQGEMRDGYITIGRGWPC